MGSNMYLYTEKQSSCCFSFLIIFCHKQNLLKETIVAFFLQKVYYNTMYSFAGNDEETVIPYIVVMF